MFAVGYEMYVSWIPDLGWYNLQLVDAQEKAAKAEKYGWGETSQEKYLAPPAAEILDLINSGRIKPDEPIGLRISDGGFSPLSRASN
jgi:hypothetical protein